MSIDLAACFQLLDLSLLDALIKALMYSSVFKCSPMTPVEKGNTDSGLIPISLPTDLQQDRTSLAPFFPVPAFAFPALIIKTISFPEHFSK